MVSGGDAWVFLTICVALLVLGFLIIISGVIG